MTTDSMPDAINCTTSGNSIDVIGESKKTVQTPPIEG